MDHTTPKEMPTRTTGWASPTPSPSPSQERLAQFSNLIGRLGFKAAELIRRGNLPLAQKCLERIRPVLDHVSARLDDAC